MPAKHTPLTEAELHALATLCRKENARAPGGELVRAIQAGTLRLSVDLTSVRLELRREQERVRVEHARWLDLLERAHVELSKTPRLAADGDLLAELEDALASRLRWMGRAR